MQCIELALCGAVTAYHATRVVHLTGLRVDGPRLAVLLAKAAVFAFVIVETHTEQREPGKEAENGAYWADSVAICPAIKECQHTKDEHHYPGDDRDGDVAHVEAGYDTAVVTIGLQ